MGLTVWTMGCGLRAGTPTPEPVASQSPAPQRRTVSAPDEVKFLDTLIGRNEATIGISKQAYREAKHPAVRALAGQLLSEFAQENQRLLGWRNYWYPNAPPFANQAELHGVHPVALASDSRSYDVRWLEAVLRLRKQNIHLTQDFQARLERVELQNVAEEIAQRHRREMKTASLLLQKLSISAAPVSKPK